MTNANTTELQAAVFRRLVDHLGRRTDVQNIDLMITAGFCRNCLADWYQEAAQAQDQSISREQAREIIYGEPFVNWKSKYQAEATPAQLTAFAEAQKRHRSMPQPE
ncbi:MAG: DUF1244 domain-containing protein [Dokdonella sp.]